eukprot:CAMPEP_0172671184 /NCGR_PEP_ID=MMETSP1074-20121228/10764_1 /TAXON_ID=2916 /ORGANISM="Ceratium fusus, Strain PA161109" /LENGTH=86 /DNA_ID=CAMNT_0013488195 /DNA_START=204 /DNA_END=464 /DNA_ORIENTATION=+
MSKRTEPASWAAASLVAQSFAEKVWVVKEFSSTVAQITCIPMAANTRVVELFCARCALVGQPTAFQKDRPTAIAAAVVKRATSMVV